MRSIESEALSTNVRPRHCVGRVLLISDHENCRVALEKSLSEQGFDVHGASTHDQACCDESLEGWEFDVLVLDIRNARFDPAQAVGKLKRTHRSARVVVCSGATGGAALGHALGAGAFAFILHPFDASQMAGLVRMAMDRVPSNDRLALRAW